MPSSSTIMTLFFALLLLVTNILPSSSVNAFGCRQFQVTLWTSWRRQADLSPEERAKFEKEYRLRNKDHYPGADLAYAELCQGYKASPNEQKLKANILLGYFTGTAAQNADRCLNLNCGSCTPTLMAMEESPVYDVRFSRCWIPMATIMIWRSHKLKTVEFDVNGKKENCDFDNVLNWFNDKVNDKDRKAALVDDLLFNPGNYDYTGQLFTTRKTEIHGSTTHIKDDVHCA